MTPRRTIGKQHRASEEAAHRPLGMGRRLPGVLVGQRRLLVLEGNFIHDNLNQTFFGSVLLISLLSQTIHDHQRTKPKQHPVGITGHGAERLPTMLASPAEWVSPGRVDGFGEDPPAWNEEKVSLLDTDHI